MRLCSLRASITQTPVCCTKQKKSEFTAIYGNYVIKSDVAATAMPSLWMKLPCDVKRVTLVVIGENSFTQHKNYYGSDPNRHFHLKNCPKLKSLKMGRYSFSDYSVIEIETVNALEVIEMGAVGQLGYSFYYASLELKSILDRNE